MDCLSQIIVLSAVSQLLIHLYGKKKAYPSDLTRLHEFIQFPSWRSLCQGQMCFIPVWSLSPTISRKRRSFFLQGFFLFKIYLFFNWKIIALQNFVPFSQTSTWISHRCNLCEEVSYGYSFFFFFHVKILYFENLASWRCIQTEKNENLIKS